MPFLRIAEPKDLFRQALAEFAPGWRLARFGRADTDPEAWLLYDQSPDHFGATVERVDRTGEVVETRVLGHRPSPQSTSNQGQSYHPAIPGGALEAYQKGDRHPIRSYLQDIGLMGG